MNLVAAGVALGAALCYAIAATLQHRAARQEPTQATLDPRLLVRLIHRPQWVVGGAADLAGAGLHGTALALGPLALVQPMLVSGLILAVPLEAGLDRRRPSRRDLIGAILGGAGLATFVIVAQPRPGPLRPEHANLLPVAAGVGLFVAALVFMASRVQTGWRATVLGIAAGAGYALAATLAKACLDRLTDDGWGLLFDWRLYALGVVGLISIVLNQNAFQAGTLAGPLTGIVLTDPLVSLVIGITAYHERLNMEGIRPFIELLALATMAAGVRLVSTVWTREPAPIRTGDATSSSD